MPLARAWGERGQPTQLLRRAPLALAGCASRRRLYLDRRSRHWPRLGRQQRRLLVVVLLRGRRAPNGTRQRQGQGVRTFRHRLRAPPCPDTRRRTVLTSSGTSQRFLVTSGFMRQYLWWHDNWRDENGLNKRGTQQHAQRTVTRRHIVSRRAVKARRARAMRPAYFLSAHPNWAAAPERSGCPTGCSPWRGAVDHRRGRQPPPFLAGRVIALRPDLLYNHWLRHHRSLRACAAAWAWGPASRPAAPTPAHRATRGLDSRAQGPARASDRRLIVF